MNGHSVTEPVDQVQAMVHDAPQSAAGRIVPHVRKELAENLAVVGSQLVLPLRSIFGTRSISIDIDQPSPWIARVTDPAVNAALDYIFQVHDVMAVLDKFPGVAWRRDQAGELGLEIFAVDAQGFVESLTLLRDACAAVLAAAWGLSVADDSLRAELPEDAQARFSYAVSVHRFHATERKALEGVSK